MVRKRPPSNRFSRICTEMLVSIVWGTIEAFCLEGLHHHLPEERIMRRQRPSFIRKVDKRQASSPVCQRMLDASHDDKAILEKDLGDEVLLRNSTASSGQSPSRALGRAAPSARWSRR